MHEAEALMTHGPIPGSGTKTSLHTYTEDRHLPTQEES